MEEFNTVHELYKHIRPALTARVEELKRNKINTTEEDIFLRLSELKWRKANNLTLAQMINDIFNVTKEELEVGEEDSKNEEK